MDLLQLNYEIPQIDTEYDDQCPSHPARVDGLQDLIGKLVADLRIAVIFGGDKQVNGAVINQTVNPRNWKSYESVAEDIAASLRRIGFRYVSTIPDDMYLGDRLRQEGIHFAWLNTGGVQGFNSVCHASAMLEMFGVPYVGHNPLSAATLDAKHTFKRDLVMDGIPTAPFFVWRPVDGLFDPASDQRFMKAFPGLAGPFIVKPVSGRASQNVMFVEEVGQLKDAVRDVYKVTANAVLIERYLPGREFCIAVCGNVVAKSGHLRRRPAPFSFAAVERVLDCDEKIFTSMDKRPITVNRVRVLDPATESATIGGLKRLAERVYTDFDIETLIRLDVRADEDGELCVLEANPKPDLAAPVGKKTSLVCSGLASEGMTYDDLILSLFADRLNILYSHRRGAMGHMLSLLH